MATKTKTSLMPKSKAKTAFGLLSEIRTLILKEPLRYNQACFIDRQSEWKNMPSAPKFAACGTRACVAGWVATLKHSGTFDYAQTGEIAAKILGLTVAQEMRLFDGEAANGEAQTHAHARSGAAHIRRFQKKHAAQLKRTRV